MSKEPDSEWRAAELRRRVENRRQNAFFATKYNPDDDDSDSDDSDNVVGTASEAASLSSTSSKPRPRKQGIPSHALPVLLMSKRELYGVQNDVFESEAKQVASIRCADQQFTVEKSMRRLKSDLRAAQSVVRQKAGRLDELQTRVEHLTRMLKDPSDEKTYARTHVADNELLRVDRITARECPRCRRSFLPTVFDAHQQHCKVLKVVALPDISQLMASSNQSGELESVPETPAMPKFLSQPPRNLRVAADGVTHNALTLQWDPPIFTGSCPIVDYELRYSVVHVKRNSAGAEISSSVQFVPPFRTSYWCQVRPVSPYQFQLKPLLADQEYRDFSIAAITKNGVSAASNTLTVVKTAPPVAPSKPLFIAVGVVTAKTITLSWTEPMDDGGTPVVDYEISFIEAVMEETITFDKNFLDVSEVVYKPRLVRTRSANSTFTLTDLLSGKEHKDFQVRAVNAAGIPGEFSDTIETIFTIAPGNEFRLLDELQAAVNARTRIIDSQFLSGFMQRYERHHYIKLVSQFIISIHPKLEPKVKAILERTELPASDDDEEEANHEPVPRKKRFEELTEEEMIAERRRQFYFRIAEIEKEMKRVEYNVQWCKDRRVDLVALIRAAENRILEKQAEMERARMFRGPQMDSDVLENGLQRFHTKDLVLALEDEIEIEQLYIGEVKADAVKTENYLRADEKRLAALKHRLQERQEALVVFQNDPTASIRDDFDGKRSSLARLRDRLLYQTFAALVQNRDDNRESKRKMRAAISRLITCKIRSAFKHWRQVARSISCQNASSGGVFGVGSTGLLNASLSRDELAGEARAMLQLVRQTDTQLQSLSWTSSQQHQARPATTANRFEDEKFYPFWIEADAKMDIRDFDGASRLYELIESNPKWVERMDSHRITLLQQNLGRALYELGNYEQAIVRLTRAALIAGGPVTGSKQDEGSALFYLAEVYRTTASLRQSIEHYERALLCFEAICDQQGQLRCYRGLESAFTRLEDPEMVLQNKTLADEIEFALQQKLSDASGKLQRLQQQLVGIGAESSKEIELERVKAIVPRLRTERIKAQYKTREEVKWSASLEKLLLDKKNLLAQGELDLKRALASDSTQVDSSVINGTNARFEIEDFKRKLAKLMGAVKAAEEHITKEILNSQVRVRNAEDEVKELESELFVETGALMRRMLSKEPLRCFRFNATNEALKNAIGTASHGVRTCVASAGLNGLLFDILTGACLSQALGDPQKEHLGDPIGHQAPIVSLFYIGSRIYTGSMDATLGVWDVKDETIGGFSCSLNRLLKDFDSSVVSIHADMQWVACGSSDCDVFLYDAVSLALLARLIAAHDKSTTAITIDSFKSIITTGGADHRVKVWEVGAAASSSSSARRRVKLQHKLEAERRGDEYFNGHLNPISCLRQIASEIVSADTGGRIVIWNVDADQKRLRICDVHKAAVTSLQFDAMKIVSADMTGSICVTDFATGHLVQTLVGHTACILDLQFDRKRLVSMSADGKLRLWYWQTRIGVGADRKKYHILGAGETLKSLSLKYRTSIEKLLKWNNLPDSSKTYLGQKLVVDIDTNGVASDELQTLDLRVSTQFGKLEYENLDFLAANKAKSEDVEAQWAAQKLAQLAKEFFPPLTEDDDEDKKKEEGDSGEEDADSDEDSQMAVDSDDEEEKEQSEEGDADQEEEVGDKDDGS